MNEEEMKKAIMELFKKIRNNGCEVGDTLSPQMILNFTIKLSPHKKELFFKVAQDLENEGYFDIKGEPNTPQYCFTLKQNGYDYICNTP